MSKSACATVNFTGPWVMSVMITVAVAIALVCVCVCVCSHCWLQEWPAEL